MHYKQSQADFEKVIRGENKNCRMSPQERNNLHRYFL
jgi:hypothetical protein